jgi:hypothetical protein
MGQQPMGFKNFQAPHCLKLSPLRSQSPLPQPSEDPRDIHFLGFSLASISTSFLHLSAPPGSRSIHLESPIGRRSRLVDPLVERLVATRCQSVHSAQPSGTQSSSWTSNVVPLKTSKMILASGWWVSAQRYDEDRRVGYQVKP